ncbi:MAG: nucleoid occlusion protein [Bacillota bacterium]|nr:nucleoid occlusion protein [Bacillota bacterium]
MFTKIKTERSIVEIPVSKIIPNPNQPRTVFKSDSLSELAMSIMQHGILQPLTVRKSENSTFELIAGERRLRAAKMCEFKTVPCIVCNIDDQSSSMLALIENLQRCDLNFFEEAEGIRRLMETYGLTQESVAIRIGKSQSAVANKLRLLKLPDYLREKIQASGLTERHARSLLQLPSVFQQESVLNTVIAEGLNVEQTEKLIKTLEAGAPSEKKHSKTLFRDVRIFVNTINHAVAVMKQSGINAQSSKSESDDYIEYRIKIPKIKGKTLLIP